MAIIVGFDFGFIYDYSSKCLQLIVCLFLSAFSKVELSFSVERAVHEAEDPYFIDQSLSCKL